MRSTESSTLRLIELRPPTCGHVHTHLRDLYDCLVAHPTDARFDATEVEL